MALRFCRVSCGDGVSRVATSAGAHVFVLDVAADGSPSGPVKVLAGGPESPVCALALSVVPALVTVGYEDKSVCVYDAASAALLCTHKVLKRPTCVAIGEAALPLAGPGGVEVRRQPLAFSADRNGDVMALDAVDGASQRCIFRHTAAIVTDVAVAGGGAAILTADREHKIRVSSLPFGKPILSYCLGHTEYVRRVVVCAAPAQDYALSGSGDGSVRLWRWRTGESCAVLQLWAPAAVSEEGAAAGDAAPAPPQPQCVFDIVEDDATPGRFAALITDTPAVTLLRVTVPADGVAASVVIEGVIGTGSQPLAVAFSHGALVVAGGDAVFRVLSLPPAAAAPALSWLDALNAALAPVKDAVGEALTQVPLTTFGNDEAFNKDRVVGAGKAV